MSYNGNSRDYNLLWSRESSVGPDIDLAAQQIAQTWRGFPRSPRKPIAHSLNIDLDSFPFPIPVSAVKPTSSRRNRGYANLSNYNTIP